MPIHDEMGNQEIIARRMSAPWIGGILSSTIQDAITMTYVMVAISTKIEMG